MRREERRALLGDKTIQHIHELVAQAPTPSPELIDTLRRILTRPARKPAASRTEPGQAA